MYPFPFNSLTEFLIGQRSGEISLWCSGTGSGKSTILRELMYHHLEEGRSVGAIMLEESPQETMDDMISLILNKPVRSIKAGRMLNQLREQMGKDPIHMEVIDDLTDEEYAGANVSNCLKHLSTFMITWVTTDSRIYALVSSSWRYRLGWMLLYLIILLLLLPV